MIRKMISQMNESKFEKAKDLFYDTLLDLEKKKGEEKATSILKP